LYALIGTTYGGDGVSTFNVPDLRGRVPIDQGTGAGQPTYVLGQPGGEENHTIQDREMPSHSHSLVSTTNASTTATPGTGVHLATASAGTLYAPPASAGPYTIMAQQAIVPTGGSQPHANIMPTLVGNFCISVVGIYPTS
jgi:microcystin-dependent protein